MPKRPLNRCLHCGHTWYPRGSNLSRKCPACGTVFNDTDGDEVTRSASPVAGVAALVGCGVLGLVFAVCAGAAIFSPRKPDARREPPAVEPAPRDPARPAAERGNPPAEPAPKPRDEFERIIDEFRADAKAAERKYKGRTVTVTGVVYSADWADRKSMGPHALLWVGTEKNAIATFYGRTQVDDVLALKKGQRAVVRGTLLNGSHGRDDVVMIALDKCELIEPLAGRAKKEPEPEPAAALPGAPPPRRLANAASENFVTPWTRRGATEFRIAGAVVARPVLVDPKGREYVGPDPVLLVRLQTRRLEGGTRELRRWVGALDSAARLVVAKRDVEPVRFPGATLAGQIEGRVTLLPGGPAEDDLLAFPVPAATVEEVVLVVNGAHAGEDGNVVIRIPSDAWKK